MGELLIALPFTTFGGIIHPVKARHYARAKFSKHTPHPLEG